jgi:predicted AlkP superfamily phosphohydrolase/phosphomutase
MPDGPRVLAVGLDAAEPTLIQELVRRGELPVLGGLVERSAWLRVDSTIGVGSGTVWPTFVTGTGPEEHHRLYGEWLWDPERMRMTSNDHRPQPFWADAGTESVGVLDMPMAAHVEPSAGFVVTEWGPYERLEWKPSVSPPAAAELLGEPHPFPLPEFHRTGRDRVKDLRSLGVAAEQGLRQRGAAAERLLARYRPELALVGFTEIHQAGHWMWQTAEPEDPIYAPLPDEMRAFPVDMIDLYRDFDRQLGRLLDRAGPQAQVFVFSLHGMRPAVGLPSLAEPVLVAAGLAAHGARSPGGWARRSLAAVKAHAPRRVKRVYGRVAPRSVVQRVAEPNLLPEHDWSATRAFSLVSDQHGWIRINLRGREAAGIVEPRDYEATCDEIEQLMRSLITPRGESLVADVLRVGAREFMPDLIVHWARGVHGGVAKLGDREIAAPPEIPWRTGEHNLSGFCLAPPRHAPPGGAIASTELHRVMLAAAATAAAPAVNR